MVEGLRGEMTFTQEPPVQKGFLLKKRKWPLKGWHKVRTGLDLTFSCAGAAHSGPSSQSLVFNSKSSTETKQRMLKWDVLMNSAFFPTEILLSGQRNLEICQEPHRRESPS